MSLVFPLALVIASTACTSTVDSPSENDGRSQQGVVCGGIANLPCPQGEECHVTDKNVPDATGTCRPAPPPPDAGDAGTDGGAVCGGIANLPCPTGQTCVIADADKNSPDATGTCR
jgi:hypothetical protein